MAFSAQLEAIEMELRDIDRQMETLRMRKETLVTQREHIKTQEEQSKSEELRNRDWESKGFPWSKTLDERLSSVFGLSSFRPHQLSAINALLSGHDVFVIMPTGGGKSLCYQLPAVTVAKGVTLVVSPLVSLMEDQVMALKKIGVGACMLNADTPRSETTAVLNGMLEESSPMKLIYVTPEKLAKSKRFMSKLQACHKKGLLAHIVIDEVHCCSTWGHDFRSDYKFLGVLRSLFPKVPICGCTATSTSRITDDCKKILNLNTCLVFRAPFNRPNLFYEVREKPDNHIACVDEIVEMLKTEFKDQSGIIYTLTIKDVETLANDLKGKGLRVAPYHANLTGESRSKIHRRWIKGDIQAVVATIAFGMGIDKPDVRFVLHHSQSKSMENYYQESGRAGRDGRPAKCILYFKFADVFRISTMVFTEQTGLQKLYAMTQYCVQTTGCRRGMIAGHFEEGWEAADCKQMCDCCSRASEVQTVDVSTHLDALLRLFSLVDAMDAKVTPLKVVNALLGKGEAKLRIRDWQPKQCHKALAERLLLALLLDGRLKEDFAFTPYSTISYLVPGSIGRNPGPCQLVVPANAAKAEAKANVQRKRKVPELFYVDDSE